MIFGELVKGVVFKSRDLAERICEREQPARSVGKTVNGPVPRIFHFYEISVFVNELETSLQLIRDGDHAAHWNRNPCQRGRP